MECVSLELSGCAYAAFVPSANTLQRFEEDKHLSERSCSSPTIRPTVACLFRHHQGLVGLLLIADIAMQNRSLHNSQKKKGEVDLWTPVDSGGISPGRFGGAYRPYLPRSDAEDVRLVEQRRSAHAPVPSSTSGARPTDRCGHESEAGRAFPRALTW